MEGQLVLAPFKKKASVFVLYTGGTLGMKPNEDGSLEPAEGYLEDQMSKMQELSHPDMPTWTLEVLEPIMDSSSMGPKDWAKIATVCHFFDYVRRSICAAFLRGAPLDSFPKSATF